MTKYLSWKKKPQARGQCKINDQKLLFQWPAERRTHYFGTISKANAEIGGSSMCTPVEVMSAVGNCT